MKPKSALHYALLALLALLVAVSAWYLVSGRYLPSLIALLGVIALVETRVRMGYRGKRRWLFLIHMLSSLVLLILLGTLLRGDDSWLHASAEAAFGIMTLTGIALIRASWTRHALIA